MLLTEHRATAKEVAQDAFLGLYRHWDEVKDSGRVLARNLTAHPGQGWTLLCNGALVFDDRGALLPDGRVAAISDSPAARRRA